MRGKRVRITEDHIKYFLNESYESFEHSDSINVDETYDKAIRANLLMGMFDDEYPASIVSQSPLSGNYLVKFDTGFTAFFHITDLIIQD